MIGEQIVISVERIGVRKVTLGISAPKGVTIDRPEVRAKVEAEGRRREP
jgi:sRNA-binding carbon storage regulator CsrA